MSTRLSKLEFQIMEVLWNGGQLSIREIQDKISARKTPAYTTVQTTVYRMETKGVVRRAKKVGNFHVFEAVVTREAAQHGVIEDLLSFFGGRAQPMMAQLAETGKLTLDDVRELEKTIEQLQQRRKDRKRKSK